MLFTLIRVLLYFLICQYIDHFAIHIIQYAILYFLNTRIFENLKFINNDSINMLPLCNRGARNCLVLIVFLCKTIYRSLTLRNLAD